MTSLPSSRQIQAPWRLYGQMATQREPSRHCSSGKVDDSSGEDYDARTRKENKLGMRVAAPTL